MSVSPENRSRIAALVRDVWPQSSLGSVELVQGLWNGYGAIVRVTLSGDAPPTAIIKLVAPGDASNHPRGWNTDTSRIRKLRSYQVEKHFYDHLANRCSPASPVAQRYSTQSDSDEVSLVLEDLDASYPVRHAVLGVAALTPCITWLAAFHATFIGLKDSGVWARGTYWHLKTRQDEWLAMPDGALKAAAAALDSSLFGCKHLTLLHGDAKVANFCFREAGASSTPAAPSVAAVDFQYTGLGCGMQDLTYLLGSGLDEQVLESRESDCLDIYFQALHTHLGARADAIEAEWRPLYPVAGADFHRFLLGWSPGHKKLTGYSDRLVTRALCSTDGIS